MKLSLYTALLAAASLVVVSCGGSDSSSENTGSLSGGFAPDKLTAHMILEPTDFDAGGRIMLTNTPARVAYFNSERDDNGNYTNGSAGSFTKGKYTYTGNYTYTKCGPNIAELKVVNLRAEPADTASDCHWTITGHLTFVDEKTIIFTGTETLVNTEALTDKGESGDPTGNDPMGFGGVGLDNYGTAIKGDEKVDQNHFPGTIHVNGGTRNFSLNYQVKMGN